MAVGRIMSSGLTETSALFEALAEGSSEAFTRTCPECGSQLAFAKADVKCHVWGYRECG